MKNTYYVYLLTNKSHRSLYIGVTSSLRRRYWQHMNKLIEGFTSKYNLNQLVYFEEYSDVIEALNRERQLKGWTRKKKMNLIKSNNPHFHDLSRRFSQTS